MSCPGSKLLQVYLMASFLYYKLNRSPITDEKYDEICRKLKKLWGTFEHQHKYLVTMDDLDAGTGYAISHYPLMVQLAAMTWWEKIEPTIDAREERMRGGYMKDLTDVQ